MEVERKRIVTNTYDGFHVDVAIGLLLKEDAYARLHCQRITTRVPSVDTLRDKPHSGMARIAAMHKHHCDLLLDGWIPGSRPICSPGAHSPEPPDSPLNMSLVDMRGRLRFESDPMIAADARGAECVRSLDFLPCPRVP